MVTLAAADSAIVCWNDKYKRKFWRPVDAIRLAHTDGNPRTEADPDWTPLFDPSTASTPPLATPNFPDHPSGHSCVTSGVVHALQAFFGTDRVAFAVNSPRFPGQPRGFERFSDLLAEIIEARIWAASTSAPPTSRAQRSASGSPAGNAGSQLVDASKTTIGRPS